MNTKVWKTSLLLALLLGVGSASAGPPILLPRTPLPKEAVSLTGLAASQYVVSVKFVDAQQVRVTSGNQVAATSSSEATAIASVLTTHGLTLAPEIDLSAQVLQDIIDEAEKRSDQAQPDWFGVYRITFPSTTEAARQNAVNALLALSSVEYLNLALIDTPPPGATPLFHDLQTYFESPALDIDHAHTLGLYGQGMTYVDVEYCWLLEHEDHLSNPPVMEPEVSPFGGNDPPYCWHGAAVTGMLSADPYNGFGVKGMAPSAAPRVNPERLLGGTHRRPEAILSAINRTNVGDIIILEMQVAWPGSGNGRYGPAEFESLVWDASRTASDAGRIVVAAAGNGYLNLDATTYDAYNERGDSGAIIVGGGHPITREWQGGANFGSTYGSRVNLQGWSSSSVATLGYGYLFLGNGDYNRSYTDVFDGTSAATPMVAAAALLTQQAVKQMYWVPLDAKEMRELLRATGKPQGPITSPTRHVGPLPGMQAALSNLNTADAGVTVTSSGSQTKIVRVEIANNGPSRATGRSVTVQLSIANPQANIQRIDTSGIYCEAAPNQNCFGTCLIYECQLPDLRFGQTPIALEWSCVGATYNPTLTTTVALSNGSQTDPVSTNGNATHTASCMPVE